MNFKDVAIFTEMAKKTKLIDKPMVKFAIMNALFNEDGEHLAKISKYIIQPRFIHQIAYPDPFFPNSEGNEGEIPLGAVNVTDALFKLDFNINPRRNIAIIGSTRKGKSLLLRYLLANQKGKFFAVDYKAGESRRILNVKNNILIFNNSFFNVLEIPQNVPYQIHRNSLIGVMCQAFGLLTGSESLALEVLDKTYRKYNFNPTLIDFYQELEGFKTFKSGPESQFLERIKNRIKLILLTFNLSYYRQYRLENMINKYDGIVWEVDGLPIEIQNFASLVIFSWLYNYASFNNLPPVIIALDESYRLFNSLEDRQIQPSLASYYINTIGARGLSIIGLSQQPSRLSNSFLANTAIKICFHLGDGENVNTIAKAMNLTKKQAEIIPYLEEGKAIVLVPENKKVELISIPYFEILDRKISDEQVNNHMEKLIGRDISRQDVQYKQLPVLDYKESEYILDDLERKLLMEIYSNPFDYKTKHFKKLNLGGSKGDKLIKQMIKNALVKENIIQTGKRGKSIILLELTEKAFKELNLNSNINPKEGSIIHRFWKEKIKEKEINKGNKAVIEHNKYGKAVDVVIINNGEEIAVEVELTDRYLIQNIEEDLKYFNKIIIACHKININKFKDIVSGSINGSDLEKIQFCQLSEFFQ